jgi:hypothetical protein
VDGTACKCSCLVPDCLKFAVKIDEPRAKFLYFKTDRSIPSAFYKFPCYYMCSCPSTKDSTVGTNHTDNRKIFFCMLQLIFTQVF